jgi:spore coat polysaccharide biosynthesis protein SpsF (cytidylyltransferase family)
VLERLIQCGHAGQATDVFRVTTECPWFAYEMLPRLWSHHVAENNDITVCDQLPEGLHFEIYSLAALVQAHQRGTSRDRSELCSNYARTHPDEFKATVFLPSAAQRRMDLRVTVDYPEDLVIARAIARACRAAMPLVPVRDIVRILDARADLRALVAPYVSPQPLWAMISQQLEFGADV